MFLIDSWWQGNRLTFATWEWNGQWNQRTHAPVPGRYAVGVAEDPRRKRVVMFGGDDSTANIDDTWEWDGAAWNQVPAHRPLARTIPAMEYDPSVGRLLLFGGARYGFWRNDTWEWDGVDWRNRTGQGPVLERPRLQWHPGLATMLLAGKNVAAQRFQVWAWQGQWNLLADGPRESDYPLRDPLMAWDPSRATFLAIGGRYVSQAQLSITTRFSSVWALTWTPAQVVLYGTGCSGTAGVPVLTACGEPTIGTEALRLDVLRGAAGSFSVLAADVHGANVMLPGGCTLLLAAPVAHAAAVTNSGGVASFTLVVPNELALRGVEIRYQAAVADPMGALAGIAAMTGSVGLRLGD
ncbi:MAG: hypothetical protein IPK26_16905 [Planctomycetes bacterium]|nr:hypothetical protein [Planctomycetota bacterium]